MRVAVCRATVELLRTSSFKELTVDQIMRAAGVSRSSFYLYFRDKNEILMLAAEDVADHLYGEADRWWQGEGEPRALVRDALEGVVAVYKQNADLLRVATEVSTYDEEVADFWRALVGRFVDATAEHLRQELTAGSVRRLDPDATADALVWMVERSCYVHLARGERNAGDLAACLTDIWMAAVYPPDAG